MTAQHVRQLAERRKARADGDGGGREPVVRECVYAVCSSELQDVVGPGAVECAILCFANRINDDGVLPYSSLCSVWQSPSLRYAKSFSLSLGYLLFGAQQTAVSGPTFVTVVILAVPRVRFGSPRLPCIFFNWQISASFPSYRGEDLQKTSWASSTSRRSTPDHLQDRTALFITQTLPPLWSLAFPTTTLSNVITTFLPTATVSRRSSQCVVQTSDTNSRRRWNLLSPRHRLSQYPTPGRR